MRTLIQGFINDSIIRGTQRTITAWNTGNYHHGLHIYNSGWFRMNRHDVDTLNLEGCKFEPTDIKDYKAK